MTPYGIPKDTLVAVLRSLAHGRPPDSVATKFRGLVTPMAVTEIARDHGWPNLAELSREARRIDTSKSTTDHVEDTQTMRTTTDTILEMARATGNKDLSTRADKIASDLEWIKKAIKIDADIRAARIELERLQQQYKQWKTKAA